MRCSKGWGRRCAKSDSKKCECACGGFNHGGLKGLSKPIKLFDVYAIGKIDLSKKTYTFKESFDLISQY